MHIAVCDDNIADRKQMERLLTRASDAKKVNGQEGYFLDLFGNIPALMQTPEVYDVIFLDMVQGNENGLDVARKLRTIGYRGLIVLTSSKIDYTLLVDEQEHENFLFMDKPILVKELNQMLDFCEKNRISPEPVVELRGTDNTIFVSGNDICYAYSLDNSRVRVHLSNGENFDISSDLYHFYNYLDDYDFIVPSYEKAVINVRMIKKLSLFKVCMNDGKEFHVSIEYRSYMKNKMIEEQTKHQG